MNLVRFNQGQPTEGAIYLTEFRYWSPVAGLDVVRLSAFNQHGHEYWMAIEDSGGQGFRTARQDAAEALSIAIEQGLSPGEVRVLQ